MKKDTHPTFHTDSRVTCVCGNTFATGSTLPEIRVEICSNCHPFYTGKQKLLDTSRRLEKFAERAERSKAVSERGGKKQKLVKRAARRESMKAKTDEEKQSMAALKKLVKS